MTLFESERGDVQQRFLDPVQVVGVGPTVVAGPYQGGLDLGGPSSDRPGDDVGGQVERCSTCDVGAGHRGTRDGVVSAALPRRVDADAGGDQVDVGSIVGEVRERVVHVAAAGR